MRNFEGCVPSKPVFHTRDNALATSSSLGQGQGHSEEATHAMDALMALDWLTWRSYYAHAVAFPRNGWNELERVLSEVQGAACATNSAKAGLLDFDEAGRLADLWDACIIGH